MRSRLDASPPDAATLVALEVVREDPALQEALLFSLYAYAGSEWSGDVAFIVDSGLSERSFTAVFSLGPAGAKIRCVSGRPARAHPHSVTCGRQVRHPILLAAVRAR